MRDDFPSNRRGYDPAAVDAHLDRIADEVDEMRRQAAAPAPLSAQAGDQVKAIVEAAERGAQEIREAAQAEAREHVANVTAAADELQAGTDELSSARGAPTPAPPEPRAVTPTPEPPAAPAPEAPAAEPAAAS